MQLTRRSSDYREIDWEQLRLVNHFRLSDFAGQVQPTFRRSPMLHLGIVRQEWSRKAIEAIGDTPAPDTPNRVRTLWLLSNFGDSG
jgi:hypothetical protein